MKSYLMVGAGGTGTHLLPPLLAYLTTFHKGEDQDQDWRLGIMDGDSVEVHNLERQLFSPAAVTMNKAKASLLPYPHMKNVVPIEDYLGNGNIGDIIHDGDTILICVDNFPVRGLIESYCNTLRNVVVINGGNERDTGSCQIWVRKDGVNVTPNMSFTHMEIHAPGIDRAELSCAEIATIPGGEQLIMANMASAQHMLNALDAVNNDNVTWTELEFALIPPSLVATDYRKLDGWQN